MGELFGRAVPATDLMAVGDQIAGPRAADNAETEDGDFHVEEEVDSLLLNRTKATTIFAQGERLCKILSS